MQVIDKAKENCETDGVPGAFDTLPAGAIMVNMRSENIFNGLLLVPVNEKIPALNSI
jgi:hypothetical protein